MCKIYKNIMDTHPCFGASKGKFGRIHLPVAPKCNISCGYCNRLYNCVNQNRPGVTSTVMTPLESMDYISKHNTPVNNLQVAGIAGPGETLYNDESFITLKLLKQNYPELIRCISTNGLALPENMDRLVDLEVDSITITMNTLNPNTAKKIYTLPSKMSIEDFLNNQQKGASMVVKAGIALKINMVYIPGVNSNEVRDIALFAQKIGANIMNIMPLIPESRFISTIPPSKEEIERAQILAGCFIDQLSGCAQCRADAVGIPCCGK